MPARVDAKDISALQASVNDASSRAGALWISFLTLAAYLTVTVGSVNHEYLFREKPIKLPVLAVDLPLVAFFAVAPFFFFLFHFYLFLQLVILVRKITTYNKVLRERVRNVRNQELLRRRLDTFLIVQLLSGDHEGVTSRLLRVIAWITLVGVPIALLLQFQVTFLPYHLGWITWVHRGVVFADIVLVWIFWFAINHDNGDFHIPSLRNHKTALGLSIFVVAFSVFVMAYAGEAVGRVVNLKLPWLCPVESLPIADCVLHGPVNMVRGRPRAYFSNVLVLPYKKLVDNDEAESSRTTTLSLRGRDLAGAVLIGTDLRKIDFTGANLNGARLDDADARGARFACADPGEGAAPDVGWPDDGCTWLQGASLSRAQLQGALFLRARLQGAALIEAQLQGAWMISAQLQASALTRADLTGAVLLDTQLQGAYLFGANLSGAWLHKAQLQKAILEGCEFSIARFTKETEISGTFGNPILAFAQDPPIDETSTIEHQGADNNHPDNLAKFVSMRKAVLAKLYEDESRKIVLGPDTKLLLRIFLNDWYEEELKKSPTNWSEAKAARADAMQKAIQSKNPEKAGPASVQDTEVAVLTEKLVKMACTPGDGPYITRSWIQFGIVPDRLDLSILATALKDPQCDGFTRLTAADRHLWQAWTETSSNKAQGLEETSKEPSASSIAPTNGSPSEATLQTK